MKVNTPEPPMEQTPPMDMQQQGMDDMGGDFMPGGEEMPMGGDMSQQSEFDTNFDAGVEADEEQDPKKYIQQLTGKLSQTLRKYNEDNGQSDADLNKYVAGMITKQAMEGLSQEDADDIIGKIQAGEDFTMEDGGEQQMPDGGEQQMDAQTDMQMQGQQMQQPNESRQKRGYNIDEIVNDVMSSYKDEKTKPNKVENDGKSYRKSAYSSPFEK